MRTITAGLGQADISADHDKNNKNTGLRSVVLKQPRVIARPPSDRSRNSQRSDEQRQIDRTTLDTLAYTAPSRSVISFDN
jgi:hypothetical protein